MEQKELITEIFNRCKAEDTEHFIALNKVALYNIDVNHCPLDYACGELAGMILDKLEEVCVDYDIPVEGIELSVDDIFWDKTWSDLYAELI